MTEASATIAIQKQEILSLKASGSISRKTEIELKNVIQNKDALLKHKDDQLNQKENQIKSLEFDNEVKSLNLKLATIQIEEKDKLIETVKEENLKLIKKIVKL